MDYSIQVKMQYAFADLIEIQLTDYKRLVGKKTQPKRALHKTELDLGKIFRHRDMMDEIRGCVVVCPDRYPCLGLLFKLARAQTWSPFEALHSFFLDPSGQKILELHSLLDSNPQLSVE